MIQQLVVNGCSYTYTYAAGAGHIDLGTKLGIRNSLSIAVSGSANSRILRTTLKHSYQTTVPTLYILGMTFVSRAELPICEPNNEFEGRWINPQNQEYSNRWQHGWTINDLTQFVNLKLKSEVFSIADRLEDLMYRMLSLVSDLKSRGHRVLLYQQADNLYQDLLSDSKFDLLKIPEIVDAFAWRAVPWQHSQGIKTKNLGEQTMKVPPDMQHPAPGEHKHLNTYLTEYIREHNILA
jgi:hypothetical protein